MTLSCPHLQAPGTRPGALGHGRGCPGRAGAAVHSRAALQPWSRQSRASARPRATRASSCPLGQVAKARSQERRKGLPQAGQQVAGSAVQPLLASGGIAGWSCGCWWHGVGDCTHGPTGRRREGGREAAWLQQPEHGAGNAGSRTAQSHPRHCHFKDLFLSGRLKHWGRWVFSFLSHPPSNLKLPDLLRAHYKGLNLQPYIGVTFFFETKQLKAH